MERDDIKRFVKERNEMLKKRKVSELRKFVNDHAELYGAEFVKNINAAPDVVLKITLHKMIVNVPSLPKAMRDKNARWLYLRGFDLNC